MSRSNVLEPNEVAMIKTMLTLRPYLSQQAILSYFKRPGRDINHARIIDIANDTTWAWIPPAPLQATLDYMSARQALPYPRAANFLAPIGAAAPISARMLAVQLTFWLVGQGLFTSGRLHGAAGRPFNWVYDCGSVSNRSFLTNAVRDVRHEISGADIDLLTLSHFDADHINGVVQLVGTGRIGTLLLPYLPLWQRLLMAFEEGIAAGVPLFEFFIDPVALNWPRARSPYRRREDRGGKAAGRPSRRPHHLRYFAGPSAFHTSRRKDRDSELVGVYSV